MTDIVTVLSSNTFAFWRARTNEIIARINAFGTYDAAIITGGTINGTVIGGTTPAAGHFTTLTVSGTLDLSATTLIFPTTTSFTNVAIAGSIDLSSTTVTFAANQIPVAKISGLAAVATSGAYSSLSGTPTLATVATSGTYADLSGKPTLGTLAALSTIVTANITAANVTYAKIQNVSAQYSILTRTSSGAGSVEELASSSAVHTFLGQSSQANMRSTGLGLGALAILATVGTSQIDAAAVTYAKIQNVSAQYSFLTRTSSGAGVVQELASSAAVHTFMGQSSQANMRSTGLGLGTIVTFDECTSAQYLANTASKALSTDKVWAAALETTLTDAATVAVDMSLGINFKVTLGGNRTLGNPTNTKVGQCGAIVFTQDGTGSRTLAFSSSWKNTSGISLTTTAAAVDILFYYVHSSTIIVITGFIKGIG